MKTTNGKTGFDDLLRALAHAPSVRPGDMDLVGRKVGRFVVERRLGQGGMGIVYEAHDPVLARKVALKVLRAGQRGSAGTRARLHEEARRVAALHHPNIAAVYDVGEHEGIVFLAMERAGGRSLRARLAAPPAFTFAQATRLLRAIASGLACAHDAGIIHRDLKPENVVMADDGAVKIIDFGIATTGGGDERPSGRPAGTRRYMAPEQAEGAKATPRADVFAFGVLAREVLSATTVGPRERAGRAALQRLVTASVSEEASRRPRDGAALLAGLDAVGASSLRATRPGALTFGAAAVAAALGVFVARSIPRSAGDTSSAAPISGLASPRAEAKAATERERDLQPSNDPTSDRRTARVDIAREDAATQAVNEGSAPIAPRAAGDPLLTARSGSRAPSVDVRSADEGAGAVPVTTAVDRRGRLFATVPLDGVAAGTRPAPAGTLTPLGTLEGTSTTQAEVVPDGHGGTVIRLTVRVHPPSGAGAGAQDGGGAHKLTPGAGPGTDVAANGGSSGDPFHLTVQHVGKSSNPPANPAEPQEDDAGVKLCTAAHPDGVRATLEGNGTMRVVAENEDGEEVMIALVRPDGEIVALGEGAARCDQEDAATEG